MALRASIVPVGEAGIGALEDEWRELERAGHARTPYASYDWLASWCRVYDVHSVDALRVEEVDGTLVALGLLQRGRLGGLRFVGGPVTPQRAPVCISGREQEAWQAIAHELHSHPGSWVGLEGAWVSAAAAAIAPRGLTQMSTWTLELPSSFDGFLAARSSKQRSDFRRRLRIAADAGALVERVGDGELEEMLGHFLRLHHRRARTKGERHPHMDERLLQLLLGVAGSPAIGLVVFRLQLAGRVVGVGVELEYGDTAWGYNMGIDPDETSLGPGMILALESIRSAIERGFRFLSMGIGEFEYKARLGARREEAFNLLARNPSLRARLVTRLAAFAGFLRGLRKGGSRSD
jgi:CelD/BcsL family acetyltransferase involved in cellulose biosynthesis